MNIWIKRSLGTVAVTGGLLFAGAAAANADDGSALLDGLTGTHATQDSGSSSSESSSSSKGSASAPISIGGIDAGTKSESSSSSSSSSETTDGDRSTKESSSSQKSSARENGLSTEGITLDPQASSAQEQASKDSSVRSGDRDDAASSAESSSSTEGSASAPVRIGGLQLSSESQDTASDARQSETRDGDRAVSESEESSSSSKNATDFGIGALELDPQAAFREAGSASSSELGDDLRDEASSSASAGAAALPVRFEGISFSNDTEDERADRSADAVVDGDRGVANEERSSSSDSTSTAFEGLGFGFAPQGAFEDERSDESLRLGGRDGIRDEASSSASSVEGAAPFSFDGLTGSTRGTSDEATAVERIAVDGDRSTRELTESSESTENGFAASGGAFEGRPTFGFERTEDTVSSALGDAVRGESTSSTAGSYTFPFDSEGITAVFDSIRATNEASLSQARDGDRSTTDASSESNRQQDENRFGTDGIAGNPSGSFEQEQNDVTDLFRR